MSSLNGVPYINRPSLSGLNSIKADSFTLGNVSISANSISGIDNIDFNSFSVSESAIFNCPVSIYGNLIVSQNIINPNLSNANTTIFNQLGNLTQGNSTAHLQVLALQNANANLQLGNLSAHTQILALQNSYINLQTGNLSAHNQILALQNANVNLQLGNSSAHGKILDLQNANVNIQLGNITAHGKILDLQNANVNIQLGNLSSHTRVTTLETKTQLLSSNALTSVFSGNLAVRSNISIEKYINTSCNIYSTSTPQLNFYGDGGVGNEYYGTIQFCSGDGASRATISSSLVSGNLSLSYGLSLSGYRVRQSGTDLLTVNTANTWVQGNLNVNSNISGYGNQHFLSGNTTVQGNLIVGNINCTSTQSFFLGNVGIGTTNARANLHVIGLSNIIGDQVISGSIGIGTASTLANVHILNSKVPANPSYGHIYCYNSGTTSSSHSLICLRTSGASGGNPSISFDIDGVGGWSIYQDNSDSDCLKIKSGWDQPSSSTYDCLKITSSMFYIYKEPSIRTRFMATMAIGSSSYTVGNNVQYTGSMQDISGTASISSGILTLPSTYAGYYTLTFSGRVSDTSAVQGCYFFAGAQNLMGSSDGIFFIPSDPNSRRCYSFTRVVYLSASTQIRSQYYASTTIDIARCEIVYHGIQS